MSTYEDKRLALMSTVWFDSSTDPGSFISYYFPGLLIQSTRETERFFKEHTLQVLKRIMQELCHDTNKHSLLEVYACIENDKEEDDRLRLCVLSTVRTNLSKELIAASVSGR